MELSYIQPVFLVFMCILFYRSPCQIETFMHSILSELEFFFVFVAHSYAFTTLLVAKTQDGRTTTVHLLLEKSRIILINYSGHHDLNLPVEHKRKSNHVRRHQVSGLFVRARRNAIPSIRGGERG